uniref:ORF3 protein n=1 Tax=Bat Coronavirus TpGX16 TaxID=3018921 RepID=A0AA49EF90_9NIDO|nr:ORF3 protein [Bat Coronavirus TpGX16]
MVSFNVTVIFLVLVANAFSKPLYIPEHCGSMSGTLLQACIRQTMVDTTGMYTNSAMSYDGTTIPFDRDGIVHEDHYTDTKPTPLSDVGFSI